jgi:hypothetical protein
MLPCTDHRRVPEEGFQEARPALPFADWGQGRGRSFAKPATVAIVSAKSFGAIQATCSGHGKVRSMHICRCSMPNGLGAVRTAPNSGDGLNQMASVVRSGGQRVGDPESSRRKASDQRLQQVPSARTIARLMTPARDHMSKADTVTIAAIEAGLPTLLAARTLTDRFHRMFRKRIEADLVPWISAASQSLIASFASGITKDIGAVHAALVQPRSNGQTEGQITKLKLIKRQLYGRAKIGLLQARLIGATRAAVNIIEIASDPFLERVLTF